MTKLKKRGARELVGLCPFHHEKSPSFEVNDDKGFYHCWGCGSSGDAIRFLVNKHGLSFMDALRDLEEGTYPEVTEAERAKRKREDAEATAKRIADAQTIWRNAEGPIAGTPAEVYARSRGITMPLPDTVRFAMTPRWRDAETGEVGRDMPAMACSLLDRSGMVVGVQCVFLAAGGRRKYERVHADGSKAKAKLSFGIIQGAAFRIGPIASEIIVCEGPEDGLTLAQELPGRSVWVTMGTAMMPMLEIPDGVQRIVLAGDNDDGGRRAIREAALAIEQRGFDVGTMFPRAGFKDFNDQLRGIRS